MKATFELGSTRNSVGFELEIFVSGLSEDGVKRLPTLYNFLLLEIINYKLFVLAD